MRSRQYNRGVPGEELEIVDVAPDPGERVRGHFKARAGEARTVEIVGWALGREQQATAVEVLADGALAGRASVALERPDVAEKFPEAAAAASAGFRLELAAKGRGESELQVLAVLQDESREPLGRIVVRTSRRGLLDVLRRS